MLIYRRDSGKGLDVWMDGIDVCYNTCRDMVKESQKNHKVEQDAMVRMQRMHQSWLQKYGPPKNMDDWKRWRTWFEESNFDKELIDKLVAQIRDQMAAAAQQNQGNAASPKAATPKAAQPKAAQPNAAQAKAGQPKAKAKQGARR